METDKSFQYENVADIGRDPRNGYGFFEKDTSFAST